LAPQSIGSDGTIQVCGLSNLKLKPCFKYSQESTDAVQDPLDLKASMQVLLLPLLLLMMMLLPLLLLLLLLLLLMMMMMLLLPLLLLPTHHPRAPT
jgi:hypothetical protein